MFHGARHQRIFTAIKQCWDDGTAVDLTSVARYLTESGNISREEMDISWMAELVANLFPSQISVDETVRLLDLHRLRRELRNIQQHPILPDTEQQTDMIIERLVMAKRGRLEPAKSAAEDVVSVIDELERGEVPTIKLGIPKLDHYIGLRRGDLLILGARPSVGKGLALDTVIPTPSGWTTIADLAVGDLVLGDDGKPTRVTFVSETHHLPCFRVTFSDGTEVVTDNEHRWLTSTRRSRKSQHALILPKNRASKYSRDQRQMCTTESVVTTEQIHETILTQDGSRVNHAVRNCAAVEGTPSNLPIDPYLFGLWLGDGTSRTFVITNADRFIHEHLISVGAKKLITAPGKCPQFRIYKQTSFLRELGVLQDKHVPIAYLRASESQRRALLAGLMDSDGTVTAAGLPQYATTSPKLASGVYELICSLGYRVGVSTKHVKGRTEESSTCFTLTYSPDCGVFRLPRKLKRQRVVGSRRAGQRMVVKCEAIPSVPTRCIQVDNQSHLFLCSKSFIPTHNTVVAGNFARGAAELGTGVLIHSLEMDSSRLIRRQLAYYAQVDNWKIQRGKLKQNELEYLRKESHKVAALPLWIRDADAPWPKHLAAYEGVIRMHPEIGLLIIDYIGLIHGIPGVKERHLQVAAVTRNLKMFARRMNIAVIALSQLNRKTLEQDGPPTMANLRESGASEQDADIILLPYTPEYEKNKEAGFEGPEPMIMNIEKTRDGRTGSVMLYYDRRYCQIADWPESAPPEAMKSTGGMDEMPPPEMFDENTGELFA